FYVDLIPGARIEQIHAPPGQTEGVHYVDLWLGGNRYRLLNGGPYFTLNEAASITLEPADQAQADRLWNALIADGGSPSQCGWCKDRFGLSWQVVPKEVMAWLQGPQAKETLDALLPMQRIDVEAVRAALEAAGRA
ncbi:MAG: VOC family protein, partial [Planctomycetota bacterium]